MPEQEQQQVRMCDRIEEACGCLLKPISTSAPRWATWQR